MGSVWCNPFSPSSAIVVSPSEASRQLQEVERKYLARMQHLETQANRAREDARMQHMNGYRTVALQFLRRRKLLQQSMTRLQRAGDVVMALRLQLEQSILTADTVSSIQSASQSMSVLQQRIDPQRVEKLLDDIEEQVHASQDVLQSIADAAGNLENAIMGDNAGALDDAELELELDRLLAAPPSFELHSAACTADDFSSGTEASSSVPPTARLLSSSSPRPPPPPSAPSASVVTNDDEQFQQLQRDMRVRTAGGDAKQQKQKKSPQQKKQLVSN
jgi:hypothetical protein